jgi:PIN domain nuclease of toxin-antitoxin system
MAEPILLDTCAMLDVAFGQRVGARARRRIETSAAESSLYLSSLSIQEVLRLVERGRLKLPSSGALWVERATRELRLREVAFDWDAALEAGQLHGVNGDPVDRGLLGTARARALVLATRDEDLLESGKASGVSMLDTRR